LKLLAGTGHHGNTVDIGSCFPLKLGSICLKNGSADLLGALRGRKVILQLRIIILQEFHPRGTAGSEHGKDAASCDPFYQLRAFLHDRHVRREVGIIHSVEAQRMKGGGKFSRGKRTEFFSEFLRNSNPNCWRALDNSKLLLIRKGCLHFIYIADCVGGKQRLPHTVRNMSFFFHSFISVFTMGQYRHVGFTFLYALAASDAAAFINGLRLSLLSHNSIGRPDLCALTAASTKHICYLYSHEFF